MEDGHVSVVKVHPKNAFGRSAAVKVHPKNTFGRYAAVKVHFANVFLSRKVSKTVLVVRVDKLKTRVDILFGVS